MSSPALPERPTMRAMVLPRPGARLREEHRPLPAPVAATDVVVRVHACAVCRTDLHLQDGDLPDARFAVAGPLRDPL